jgi:hypothetical protein
MQNLKKKKSSFLDNFRIRNRLFASNEDGQVMLMTAILALALLAFVASILPVGQIITDQIQLQNAADAAAMTATTWMARGANYLQGTNGFHWDVTGLMILVIEGITYYYTAKIIKDACNPLTWILIPIDWFAGMDKIGKAVTAEKAMAESVEGMQVLVAEAVPMLAMSHASAIARQNGADVFNWEHIDELRENLPGLPAGFTEKKFEEADDEMREWLKDGEFGQGLLKWLRERGVKLEWGIGCLLNWIIPNPHGKIPADAFKPYCWPVSPSLSPEKDLAFSYSTKAGGWGATSPYTTEFWWPFALDLLFIKFIEWDEPYYESTNVDTTITFMVSKSPRKSYMLNDLLLRKEDRAAGQTSLLPYSYALGAAKMTGDKLYQAGQKDSIYISIPIFAITLWPFPFVRLFVGYNGNFSAQMVPVQVLGTPGTSFLVQH